MCPSSLCKNPLLFQDHRKYNYLYILSLFVLEFSGSVSLINIALKIKILSLLSGYYKGFFPSYYEQVILV